LQKQLMQQRKAGLQMKKDQLVQSYNEFDLSKHCAELKQNWQLQQRHWQLFISQYA